MQLIYYNKKCFFSVNSADQNDFWKIMWHWRPKVMMLKIQKILLIC